MPHPGEERPPLPAHRFRMTRFVVNGDCFTVRMDSIEGLSSRWHLFNMRRLWISPVQCGRTNSEGHRVRLVDGTLPYGVQTILRWCSWRRITWYMVRMKMFAFHSFRRIHFNVALPFHLVNRGCVVPRGCAVVIRSFFLSGSMNT